MNRREFNHLLTVGAGSMSLSGPDELALAADAPPGRPASEDAEIAFADPRPPVTVEDYRRIAQSKLSLPTYEYIAHGSADGYTLRSNIDDLQQINLLPPLLRGVFAPAAGPAAKQPGCSAAAGQAFRQARERRFQGRPTLAGRLARSPRPQALVCTSLRPRARRRSS